MRKVMFLLLLISCLIGCKSDAAHAPEKAKEIPKDAALATFAGGCFWCMETPFEDVDGVYAVVSGYSGGKEVNPTYKQVSSGRTGHTESIQISYNPDVISYEELLEIYWRQINPTDAGGQFVDRGSQYRAEIFYHNDAQKIAAEKSKKALADSGRFKAPIVTKITAYTAFYPAEDYHQDYYKKSPQNYYRYRKGSGRDQFIKKVWGEDAVIKKSRYVRPSEKEIKKRLTSLQYQVTQQNGTERPFANEYWDNKKEGIYVDIVSGEPLFSSKDKYKSGTGWPSFIRPLEPNNIIEKSDFDIGYARTEVRSKMGDSHLGHVFPDGPKPTGLRYCINSAALRFIEKGDLEKEGYGKYADQFKF